MSTRQITEPVVSVVIRAFNCEKYIDQTVESILTQTFQDFEVIIVDDASTDGTEAMLQTHVQRDSRIRLFRNETNHGPVRTMNIGLRQVRGEFVAIQDADDLSLPHRLETQLNFLKANPAIALIGGGAYVIDEEGEEVKLNRRTGINPAQLKQELEHQNFFVHSSVMFRRNCIEAIGLYDEFFKYAHDYEMLIRMAGKFDIAYFEDPLVKRRWLSNNLTARKMQAQRAFAELARIRRKAEREGISLDLTQEYDRLLTKEYADHALTPAQTRARYYYHVGILLFEKGKIQVARQRFLQALKSQKEVGIFLRALFFYGLSFWPSSFHSKPIKALRKAI